MLLPKKKKRSLTNDNNGSNLKNIVSFNRIQIALKCNQFHKPDGLGGQWFRNVEGGAKDQMGGALLSFFHFIR